MIQSRYRRILWFFGKIILSVIFWDIILPRLGLRRLSRQTRPTRMRKAAISFRALAIQMGGVLIKVGQFLSARLDVLPREVTNELAGLQDEVQPESLENIRKVIEAEFGASISEKFLEFNDAPVASASIGQVHRARLRLDPSQAQESPSNPYVVVKVQRPDIQKIVEVDLRAIKAVGGWLHLYWPIRKRANVPELVEEFSRTLYEEIDYLAEGKNAETFAENFKNDPSIRIPQVFWSHTTRRVLTLEDVQSIKITDYTAMDAAGIDRAQIAKRLFQSYLKQFFDDRFFHADPHPGNLFVTPMPKDGDKSVDFRLTFVDFGMVGRVSPKLFEGLTELLLAVGLRDGSRVVKAYQILDVLLPGADLELIARASNRVFESFWGKTAPEMMSFHQEEAVKFVSEFGSLMYEMPFQVPENLILLGRCLGILSGICTGLDPDFNVWTSIAPYATKLVQGESGNRFGAVLGEIGEFLRILVALPGKAETLLNRIEQGKLVVSMPEIKDKIAHLERTQSKMVGAILFSAFLLGSIQLHHYGETTPAAIVGLAGILSLIWTLFIA
jgi:predicted unusual protein kinase regulating ubiquinone biosynthesis (AarF/ABC1/UbiB family)